MVAQFLKQILNTNVLQRQVVIKTPEQQHAGLIVFVGRLMAICFSFTVMAFIYGILFVDQPSEQAPTDAQLIDLLSTLLVFLTGTLSGLVASNGLKSKSNPPSE
jgi:Na+/proline symporter